MSLATPRKGYKSVPWLFGKEIEIPEEWELEQLGVICGFTQGIQIPFIEMNGKNVENTIRYLYIQDFESDHDQKSVKNIYPEKIVTENDVTTIEIATRSSDIKSMEDHEILISTLTKPHPFDDKPPKTGNEANFLNVSSNKPAWISLSRLIIIPQNIGMPAEMASVL